MKVTGPKRKAAAALILSLLLAPGIYFATRPHDAVSATRDRSNIVPFLNYDSVPWDVFKGGTAGGHEAPSAYLPRANAFMGDGYVSLSYQYDLSSPAFRAGTEIRQFPVTTGSAADTPRLLAIALTFPRLPSEAPSEPVWLDPGSAKKLTAVELTRQGVPARLLQEIRAPYRGPVLNLLLETSRPVQQVADFALFDDRTHARLDSNSRPHRWVTEGNFLRMEEPVGIWHDTPLRAYLEFPSGTHRDCPVAFKSSQTVIEPGGMPIPLAYSVAGFGQGRPGPLQTRRLRAMTQPEEIFSGAAGGEFIAPPPIIPVSGPDPRDTAAWWNIEPASSTFVVLNASHQPAATNCLLTIRSRWRTGQTSPWLRRSKYPQLIVFDDWEYKEGDQIYLRAYPERLRYEFQVKALPTMPNPRHLQDLMDVRIPLIHLDGYTLDAEPEEVAEFTIREILHGMAADALELRDQTSPSDFRKPVISGPFLRRNVTVRELMDELNEGLPESRRMRVHAEWLALVDFPDSPPPSLWRRIQDRWNKWRLP